MIEINDECIGCGLCASECPEVFEMKDSKAIIKKQESSPCVDEAIENCPVDAISK